MCNRKQPAKRTRLPLLSLLVLLILTSSLNAAAMQVAKEDEVTIRLSFMGDCVIGGEEHTRRRDNSFHSNVADKGYA